MSQESMQCEREKMLASYDAVLIDALAVICRHIEELERIATETKACVLTTDAKKLAEKIVDEITSRDNKP